MAKRPAANSMDEYIAAFPTETQKVLQQMRAVIKASAPEATETISYAIPTFDLNGHLVHFAGYKNHIGFYPAPSGIEAFKEELTPYKTAKGSVQFPLGQPLPTDLIRRIVEFRVKENTPKSSLDGDLPAGIGNPARRALARAGYTGLKQLTGIRESDLRRMNGVGPKAIGVLRTALATRGESFADEAGQRPVFLTER